MDSEIDWNGILNIFFGRAGVYLGFMENKKGLIVKSALSLLGLSETTRTFKGDLEDLKLGEGLDVQAELRMLMRIFEKGQESIHEENLKQKVRLAYLLCRLFLSESERHRKGLLNLASSLKNNNKRQ
jgi:hypothetical protein